MVPGEGHFPVPITGFVAARHNKRAARSLSFLAILGVTAGAAAGRFSSYLPSVSLAVHSGSPVSGSDHHCPGQIDTTPDAEMLQNQQG